MTKSITVLFSDYFEIDPKVIETYGSFNISLISDLPLFIDPFLLFNSDKKEYKKLHDVIIKYLKFLRNKSVTGQVDRGLILAWYRFKEVDQTWFGFSTTGNKGKGLGKKFATSLNKNFGKLFSQYGDETITTGTHLEKLCLVRDGVGRDSISDFTTNLIKEFLLEYTQKFAQKYIKTNKTKKLMIDKVSFNYETESWVAKEYTLPFFNGDFVLLTPKDILTKDEVWINKNDFYDDFSRIKNSLSNEELRSQLNNFLRKKLGIGERTKKEEHKAYGEALIEFPELLDHYVKYKEDSGDNAVNVSSQKVKLSELVYVENFRELVRLIRTKTEFDKKSSNSYKESLERAIFVKHIVEDCDGYRYFYIDRKPIRKEEDLKILYRMTWFSSEYDVNTEANNGRGPADTVVSKGSKNKSLVEFKLASNGKLKQNLENQTKIYEKAASSTDKTVKIIIYFSIKELAKVKAILKVLKLEKEESIVLIDARSDNKISASNVK